MKLITKLILLGAAVVLLLFLGSTLGFLGFGLIALQESPERSFPVQRVLQY